MSYPFDDEPRLGLITAAEEKLDAAASRAAVIEVVRDAARDIFRSDGVTFVLREGEYCYYAEEDAIGPLWKGQRFKMTACISGWVMGRAQTVAIEDVFTDPRIPHDVYRHTFVKSLIMTPAGENSPAAAIGAYWAEKQHFTDADIAAVKTMGFLVGGALKGLIR
jgi:two-component system CheB/CheR fusion protein